MASTSLCMVFLLAGDQQQREGVLPRVNNFGRAFHPCGRCRDSPAGEVGRSSSRFEINRPSMINVNSSACRQTRDRGPLRRERAGAPTQRDVQCSASDCCVLREQRPECLCNMRPGGRTSQGSALASQRTRGCVAAEMRTGPAQRRILTGQRPGGRVSPVASARARETRSLCVRRRRARVATQMRGCSCQRCTLRDQRC